ncbi:MAG: RluA family pseudouridine synthase [Planctomycetota bacterium]
MKLTVEAAHDGERLDKLLAARLDGVSRAVVMKYLKEGRARVNRRPAKPGLRVAVGDEVELPGWDEAVERIRAGRPEGQPEVRSDRRRRTIEVIYEDEFLVAVNKPAGLVMHPGKGHEEEGLDILLREQCGPATRLVHRIDRDTSGVVVAARGHPKAARRLTKDFAEGDIEKEYLALTRGVPRPARGTIDAPLLDTKAEGQKVRVDRRGRPARTDYEVLEAFDGFALVQARPLTGRRHQIRVHLGHIGCPLAVDPLHGPKQRLRMRALRPELPKTWKNPVVVGRTPLHAHRLRLRHPETGADLALEAPVPPDMEEALRILKQPR